MAIGPSANIAGAGGIRHLWRGYCCHRTMQLVSSTPFVKAAPGTSGESYDNSLLCFAIA
ncbi:MAG: hypothetical protein AAF609_12430 [Cyanobacteria bacterium P01_C01_bin.120]